MTNVPSRRERVSQIMTYSCCPEWKTTCSKSIFNLFLKNWDYALKFSEIIHQWGCDYRGIMLPLASMAATSQNRGGRPILYGVDGGRWSLILQRISCEGFPSVESFWHIKRILTVGSSSSGLCWICLGCFSYPHIFCSIHFVSWMTMKIKWELKRIWCNGWRLIKNS